MINIGQEREVLFWKVHLMNLIAFASGGKMKYDRMIWSDFYIVYLQQEKEDCVSGRIVNVIEGQLLSDLNSSLTYDFIQIITTFDIFHNSLSFHSIAFQLLTNLMEKHKNATTQILKKKRKK